MYEIEIPSGVTVKVNGDTVVINGKLGSTSKHISTKFVNVSVSGTRVVIDEVKQKNLAKKSALATTALSTQMSDSISGVQNGVSVKMKLLFAHFPASLEVKGSKLLLKNLFGEKVPREVVIVGDTKVDIKGPDVTVRGVDKYEVGQTIANIRKGCYARGYDTRVFQDGIYINDEE